MKVTLNSAIYARCCTAIFRESMTEQGAARQCPVRKCRRDGLCAGPLVGEADFAQRLIRIDAADLTDGEFAAPLCFFHVTEAMRTRVVEAYEAGLRALVDRSGSGVTENTRALSSRRWRKLRDLAW